MKIGNLKLKIVKRGFTLIELLVVIGIVVLLTVGSVAGISASTSKRKVKTTAEKLKSFLMEARSRAMNPDDTSFGVEKFQVQIYTSLHSDYGKIKLFEFKSDGSSQLIQTFNIPRGAIVGPVVGGTSYGNMSCAPGGSCGATSTIFFFSYAAGNTSTIGQLTDIVNQGNNVLIKVSDSSDQEKYQLEIDRITGLITITKI